LGVGLAGTTAEYNRRYRKALPVIAFSTRIAMSINRIGVVGAGQMGNGIAHVLALAGYDVVLHDIVPELLDKALGQIRKNMGRQVARAVIQDGDIEPALARIKTVRDLPALADCDMVIEAALEDEALKRSIFQTLAAVLRPEAIIATNTSSISITRLAAASGRAERFIGLHFMNPVPVMQLVEVIRGIATDDSTYQAALELVKRIGKTAAYAEDFPAFIVNRILLPMINEAVYTLYEGVGNVEAIDTAMRLGANHPMGPLQLADFIGLDTCLAVMQVLYEGLADSKYRPCPLLVKYVEAGWLGRKTGRGFYDYRSDHPVPTR
jgi:3-hydroxybutyryl-CoA dehydrogenase